MPDTYWIPQGYSGGLSSRRGQSSLGLVPIYQLDYPRRSLRIVKLKNILPMDSGFRQIPGEKENWALCGKIRSVSDSLSGLSQDAENEHSP